MTKITDRCWDDTPEVEAPFFVVLFREKNNQGRAVAWNIAVQSSLLVIKSTYGAPRCEWVRVYIPIADGLRLIWTYDADDGKHDYGWRLPIAGEGGSKLRLFRNQK